MQSEVTQPPTTSKMLSGSVRLGAAPDHSPAPPMIIAPSGMAKTGLTRTAPSSAGSGRLRSFAVGVVEHVAGGGPDRHRLPGPRRGAAARDAKSLELRHVRPHRFESATRGIPWLEDDATEHMDGLDRGRPSLCCESLRELEDVPGGVREGDLLADLFQRPPFGGASPHRLRRARHVQGVLTVPMRMRSRPSICPSSQAANCSWEGCCSLTTSSISSWMWVKSFRNSLSSIAHLLGLGIVHAGPAGQIVDGSDQQKKRPEDRFSPPRRRQTSVSSTSV